VEAKPGAFAPDFEATTLTGERVRLSDFRGKAVVLNFWGTTCVSCVAEIPNLERVWKEQAPQGLVVLGVNVGDDRRRAESFLQRLGATYPSVLDPGQVLARAYRAPGLPMTVFIAADGRIERIIAGEISYAILDRFARVVLGQKDVAGLNDPLPIRFVSPLPPAE
jgi:peroxiredoxin